MEHELEANFVAGYYAASITNALSSDIHSFLPFQCISQRLSDMAETRLYGSNGYIETFGGLRIRYAIQVDLKNEISLFGLEEVVKRSEEPLRPSVRRDPAIRPCRW